MVNSLVIVGPSCSGKSTIAKLLAEKLKKPFFSLDDYYIKDADPIYLLGADGEPYKTWERPYMYDGARLANDSMWNQAIGGVVIEGFVALQYQEIRDINALRIYIDVSFDECLRRRKLRPRHSESDMTWEMLGERETREFVEPQKNFKGVSTYNGNASIDTLVNQIYWEYADLIQ